jgi:hypothetical protein
VFAYLPTHYDTLYTTFTNASLRKLATDHFGRDIHSTDYGGFPVQKDGGNLDWVEILEGHDEVRRVDLTPVWKTALGGEDARLFTSDGEAIHQIIKDIQKL